jgi:hypothetical protein
MTRIFRTFKLWLFATLFEDSVKNLIGEYHNRSEEDLKSLIDDVVDRKDFSVDERGLRDDILSSDDFTDGVVSVIESYDFDDIVEHVVEKIDFSDTVEEAIDYNRIVNSVLEELVSRLEGSRKY